MEATPVFFLVVLALISCGYAEPAARDDPTPVVIWHGMGDSCCNPLSMGSIKRLIERNVRKVYVKSLEIGSNIEEDTLNGFFMNVNDQVQMVCDIVGNDTKLQNGYNAIGFSQGGQFLRAVAQRCPTPPMLNLISVGGQHQGVFGFPQCPGINTTLCEYVRRLLNFGAYESSFQIGTVKIWENDYAPFWSPTKEQQIRGGKGVYGFPHCPGSWTICAYIRKMLTLGAYVSDIQNRLVQAEYWHDPLNEDEYKAKSVFLADINQEQKFVQSYKDNLMKLKNLVLVKFGQDTMVVPRESEWFGYYSPGQDKKLYTMFDSPLYQKDLLGLKSLNDTGRLHFLTSDTDHLQFTEQWFIDNILKKFLM